MDFVDILIGPGSLGTFIGFCLTAFIAALAISAAMASVSYKAKESTPIVWSWRYFFADNLGNLIAAFFLLPLFVRLIYPRVEDSEYMVVICIGLGFGFKALTKLANNFGIWTTKSLANQISNKLETKDSVG